MMQSKWTLGALLPFILAFGSTPGAAQSDNTLVQPGEGGRTGSCLNNGPVWQALGWSTLDAAPLRNENMREPGQPHYRDIHQSIQSILVSCSTQIEQQQVNRDPDRNVWRPEIYVTARGFGSVAPSGNPVEIAMTFVQDRRDRDKFYLERLLISGDLQQGQEWARLLEQQWGPAPDTLYDPAGVRIFGNTYGDIYNSEPTDEVRVWGWLQMGRARRTGSEYGNYQTTLTCNISRDGCALVMQTGGTIPHWSPRYRPRQRR